MWSLSEQWHNARSIRTKFPGPSSWCADTDLSPAYCYELIAAGTVESVKIGGKRLITTSPREFVESLRGEAA
jgi:hypothetical protein